MKKQVLIAVRPLVMHGKFIDPDVLGHEVVLPDDHGLSDAEVSMRIAKHKIRVEEIDVPDPPPDPAAAKAATKASKKE
jgi:hypothetical protein